MKPLIETRLHPSLSRLGVTLRCEEDSDGEWLAELYACNRAVELTGVPWPGTVKAHFIATQFKLQAAHFATNHPQADRLILLVEGERAGRLYVDRSRRSWRLMEIGIAAHHQSKGIGTALVRWLQREGRREGIDLHVARDNPRALRLYARLDFVIADDGSQTHFRMTWPPRVS